MSFEQVEKRQTGRTTRMLEAAIEAMKQNPIIAVYVIATDRMHALYLEDASRRLGYKHDGVSPHKIIFITPSHPQLDIQNLTMRGEDPCFHVVLADHFALERHFTTILCELHRYDKDQKQGGSE
jgi:ribosome biogenesis protein Nip4